MTPPGQQGGDGAAGSQIKISLPLRGSKRKRRPIVFLISAGAITTLLSGIATWIHQERSAPAEQKARVEQPAQVQPDPEVTALKQELAALRGEVTTLRTDVDALKAKEAERQRRKELDDAIEARLIELANKVGPGRLH